MRERRFGTDRSEDRAGRRDHSAAGALRARGAGLLIASLAAALVSVCLVTMAVAAAGSSRPDGTPSVGSGGMSRLHEHVAAASSSSPALIARSNRLERKRLAQRRRWLDSRVASAQRLASRMEFHGLGAAASGRLLTHDFGSHLAGVSANPAASLAAAGSVVRYLSDDSAVVRTPHGLELDTSSVPLRVGHGTNVAQPVSLKLHEAGAAYTAANPLQSVSVSQRLSGGVTVGSSGIRLVPQGADVPGSLVGGQSVFFPSIAADEDTSIAPTIRGVDLSTVLRSQSSPKQISYRVVLPTDATLQTHDGGAVVSRDGKTLASVPAPVAWDAQGTAVPVSMSVSGEDLLLSVHNRGPDVAYPVLVDPTNWKAAPVSRTPITKTVSA